MQHMQYLLDLPGLKRNSLMPLRDLMYLPVEPV